MASYTEGLLRDNLREVKGWASALTSLLKAEKLKLPNSKSYNESIMKFETRTKNIAVNIVMLETANRERQERKLEMPQEDFNSAVLTDLVKSRQLLVQLKEVGGDLGKLRVMAMSSLERLEIKPSSIAQENAAAGTSKPKETKYKVEKRVHVRAHTRKWPERKQQ